MQVVYAVCRGRSFVVRGMVASGFEWDEGGNGCGVFVELFEYQKGCFDWCCLVEEGAWIVRVVVGR